MKSVNLEEVVALNELEVAEVLKMVVVVELQEGWAYLEEVEEQRWAAEEELRVEKVQPTLVVEARLQMVSLMLLAVEEVSVVVAEPGVEVLNWIGKKRPNLVFGLVLEEASGDSQLKD